MRLLCFVAFSLLSLSILAQQPYPQDYFSNPLKQTLILSGTFAELRSNHFHSGLDIKTNGKQGLKVYASADGYVSRIKISRFGYGKALYITHQNGYTTVYAHLQKFAPEIEAFVKAKQYEKESFEIELFPKIDELIIHKDSLVAFSGNTGGSSGPHLHFEIRDKDQHPMNPMLFGIDVKDTTRPEIYNLYAYPLSKESHVEQKTEKIPIRIQKLPDGNYKAEPIVAYGEIGFGIVSNDRQDYASNKNGLRSISTYFNGEKYMTVDFDRFSFDETKHLNRYIDYANYIDQRKRIQKLFIEKNNPLSLFTFQNNNGKVIVKDSTNSIFVVDVKDFKNNTASVHIPIVGVYQKNNPSDSIYNNYNFINASKALTLEDKLFKVDIPANTFYEDLLLDFKVNMDTLKVQPNNVPLQKSITIKYDASHYAPEVLSKLFIGSVSKWGSIYPISTQRKGTTLISKTTSLGTYTLGIDDEGPEIKPNNFKDGSWMSNYRYLKINISDKISGISNFRATVNDAWILMEYDPKTNTLTHDFNDGVITETKNILKLLVTDHVGNSSKFETTFYRK